MESNNNRNDLIFSAQNHTPIQFIEKKCPNCMAPLKLDCNMETAFCQYCGATILVKRTPPQNEMFEMFTEDLTSSVAKKLSSKLQQKKRRTGLIIVTSVIATIVALFVIIELLVPYEDQQVEQNRPVREPIEVAEDVRETYVYQPGETFTFNDFNITIYDDFEWFIVEDERHHFAGQTIIGVPITLENIGAGHRQPHWPSIRTYGPRGFSLDRVWSLYFGETNIQALGNMRVGAVSSDRYFYLIYEESGSYVIVFSSTVEANREVEIFIEIEG